MSIINDIKTIVKSDETQRKLDRLYTGKDAAKKNSIGAIRTTAFQTGDTAKSLENTGNGPPVEGVDVSGAVVAPEQSSSTSPTSSTSSSNTYFSDKGLSGGSSFGGSFSYSSGNGTTTDMSGALGNPPTGGSSVKAQAQEGANDTELQAKLDAIDADTQLTTEEKAAAKQKVKREHQVANGDAEPGVYTGRELADNAPYVPSDWGSNLTVYTDENGNQIYPPNIKGIVGFDIEGEVDSNGDVKAVKIGLQNLASYIPSIYYPTPSDNDATANYQQSWTDPETPPNKLGFTAGYYWYSNIAVPDYMSNPYDFTAISSSIVKQNYGDTGQTGSIGTIFGPNSSGFYYKLVSVTAVDADTINIRMIETTSGGVEIGSEFTAFQILRTNCGSEPAGATAICLLTDDAVSNWPLTGTYALALIEGKFIANQYDSEVPLKYSGEHSTVEIALGDGVNVVDTRTAKVEIAQNGGVIFSVYNSVGTFQSAMLLDSKGVRLETTSTESKLTNWRPRDL